jgi:AcrR family transcriptional regulator
MSRSLDLLPPNPARQRIHAAAMKLFAERGVTKVNISELAAAAGMARGTIYSHVPDVERLFEVVAAGLAHEMIARVTAGFAGVADPAARLSIGVRQYVRRAHEEPPWGRFMSRFGLSPALLQALLDSDPLADLRAGVDSGRYRIGREQLPAIVGLLAGGTLAAMLPVLEGHTTWRDSGTDTVELLLVALGIDRVQARAIATIELPPLPPLPVSHSLG